jgi:hypothetical protein
MALATNQPTRTLLEAVWEQGRGAGETKSRGMKRKSKVEAHG